MKIISYNVNGIRAALNKDFLGWLESINPDVVCLQETKVSEGQLDFTLFEQAGYPYHYWFSAQKKGYSGVAILSKTQPKEVTYGTGISYMDEEGRNLRADFDDFSIMSLYLPSASNIERLPFKLHYMADFQEYVNTLKTKYPNLIIAGDFNICHQAIDIHDPVRNAQVSGFLPVERDWIDRFMKSGFIDSFRYFNQQPHQYSWWTYRANARANNKGWRIDYQLVSEPLQSRLLRAALLPEAKHSDHCPVLLEIS